MVDMHKEVYSTLKSVNEPLTLRELQRRLGFSEGDRDRIAMIVRNNDKYTKVTKDGQSAYEIDETPH